MAEAIWDVFHAERLESERGLTTSQVRQSLARGDLKADDLIRPAGSSDPWVALADQAEIHQAPEPPPKPIATRPTPPAPNVGMGTGTGTGFDLSNEFDAESIESVTEEIDDDEPENETRFFHGMLEEEFDVLSESAEPPSESPPLQLGPAEDSIDSEAAGFPRNDGKGLDELDLDPGLELNPKHLGRNPQESLETWDDGEPDSLERPQGSAVDDAPFEFVDQGNDVSLEAVIVDDEDEDEAFEDEEEEEEDDYDPIEEEEAAAEFTLARGSADTIEELDLAAMVDVAFQLVLFFLVTATTVLYKSLEVPKPNPETAPAASATQGKSLDELKNDFILVEIDPAGLLKIDQEAVDARPEVLVKRLRSAREETGRQSMLLSADFSTPHRSAVLAYDAANEIGLGIAIARPQPKQ